MEKEKGHSDTSRAPPYPEKRATLTHPPYSHFSKRKRRLEICYFKTAAWLLYFVLAHECPAAETTVFLLSRWATNLVWGLEKVKILLSVQDTLFLFQ